MIDLTKKRVLKIKLSKFKTINVLPPTKQVYDQLIHVFKEKSEAATNELIADILSNNTTGKKISIRQIKKLHDYDKTLILEAYTEFINSIKNDPN